MKAKALLFIDVDQMIVETATLSPSEPYGVIIETWYTCISPDTELHCLADKQPDPMLWPSISGYVLVGEVVHSGDGAQMQLGTLVFCTVTQNDNGNYMWGNHMSHAIQSEDAVVTISEVVNPLDASIVPLAAIAFYALQLVKLLLHETVVSIRSSPIGQLAARLYVLTSAYVVEANRSAKWVVLVPTADIEAVVSEADRQTTLIPVLPCVVDIIVAATDVPVVGEQTVLTKDIPWDNTVILDTCYIAQKRELGTVLYLLQRRKFQVADLIGDVQSLETSPQIYAAMQPSKDVLLTTAFDRRT